MHLDNGPASDSPKMALCHTRLVGGTVDKYHSLAFKRLLVISSGLAKGNFLVLITFFEVLSLSSA